MNTISDIANKSNRKLYMNHLSSLAKLRAARLRIEELEEALREIANPANWEGMDWISHGVSKWIARAALEKKHD